MESYNILESRTEFLQIGCHTERQEVSRLLSMNMTEEQDEGVDDPDEVPRLLGVPRYPIA